MWTIYKYFDCVIGSISQCSNVRDDFVNFLLPKVVRCDDMKCKIRYKKESHHKDAVELALKKFASALLRNHGSIETELAQKSQPVTKNKPQKRKAVKMK